MRTIIINLATYKNRVPVRIGFQGENEVSQIKFDFTAWAEEYGEGAITLVVQRKGDSSPYPLALTISDHFATWNITDTDLAREGEGEAQLSYIVGTAVKRSEIFSFTVKRSLDSGGSAPDPYVSWLEQVQQIGLQVAQYANEAEESANESAQHAESSRGYASVAKQAVVETLEFTDSGNGDIVISFNTEV